MRISQSSREPLHGNDLIISKQPIYSDTVSALFKKERLKTWKGVETIKVNPQVAAGPSQIRKMLGDDIPIKEFNYRDQCIQMLIADCIHYYIELD